MPCHRSTRRVVWLYIAGGVIILLSLYLVRTSEQWRANPNLGTSNGRTTLPQAPRPWQSDGLVPQSKQSDSAAPSYTKAYMLTLRIPEQMTMSSIHFHQFLNVANDWNFTGVEPFAYSASSTLYGLRSSHANDPKGSIPFNKLYNSTLHNKYLGECMKRQPDPETGIPILFVPMVDFLRSSYRKLVLVHFVAHAGPQVIPSQTCSRVDGEVNGQKEAYIDCSSAAKTHGMFSTVEQLLSKEEGLERSYPSLDGSPPLPEHLEEFKVVQAFCIKQGIKISLRRFKKFVFDHVGAHRLDNGTNEFSIIFISWQGRFTHPLVDSDVKNYINNCRIPFGTPFYSDYVMNAAKRYVESLNLHGQPYLSMHIRFEKLIERAGFNRQRAVKYVDCCMKRLNSAISVLMTNFSIPKGNVVLNWDYSPFGSTVCPIRHCKELANDNLKKLNVKPSFVDPKKIGLPVHRGLIALIEMNVLYSGKVLLTAGYGSYQLTIIQSFISAHQEQFMSEKGITNASIALNKARELVYGHVCGPGNSIVPEFVDELKVEPKCTP